jgi:DNA-binding Lrp family transcriptional regulator
VDAFLYLRVSPGRVEDVVVRLLGSKGVRHAVAVVGDWDVMAAVEGPDLQAIAETVLRTVHRIDGVQQTTTTPVVPADVLSVLGHSWATQAPMRREGEACYVHIRAAAGAASGVVEALAEMDDIAGVAMVAGDYDVIAEIPASWEQAARVILDKIRPIPGVITTRTLVAVPYLEPEESDVWS